MTSLGSNVILGLMKVLNYKNKLLKKMKTGVDKSKPCLTPLDEMHKKFNIISDVKYDCPVYTISPKTSAGNVKILFFHGGAYVGNFNKRHWKLLSFLVENSSAIICAVDYPLAPKNSVEYTFDRVTKIYQDWIKPNDGSRFVLMGDSSGGGLAVSLNMWASINKVKVPDELILLSPWVDINMDNEQIKEIEKSDPFLSAEALRLCGKSYAGKLDSKNYLLSPIYGDLSRLSKTHIYSGTRDILYPDIAKFCIMLKESNVETNDYFYTGMLHDFVLFSFKEANHAKESIVNLL